MPAVAEVQFKATGSQEVEGAFKSIGTAAGEGTTKIQQNSSAMKSVGQGMKSATSGIVQTTTAFATLALSVVSTWRAYRDLGDAQLGVDRANFKVQKSTQAVATAQKLVAGLKAGMKKTDLESVAATSKIIAREEELKKKLKDGSITRKAAKAEQDAINLARSKVGSDKAAELAKAEQDLKNKTEALGLVTESAAQKQKHFNDSTQDFYLSLLPTAISVIATAVSGLESMKNIVGGGGGGLIGSLGGIGLVLGAGSLALLAYKNNWLGFRDAIGGVIKWIQDRFGAWKDTIQEVFALIQKHDWGGAFNKIKEAAAAFWADLKKTVPFFGEVENLVNKIKAGNWKGAFLQIWKAASDAWETIKKNIPFLGDVEKFITGIAQGKWSQVFDAIKSAYTTSGLKTVIDSILGENWITNVTTRLQSIPAILKSTASMAKAAAEKGDWKSVGVTISSGIAEGLKASGGQDVIDTMLKTGIGPAAILQAWKDPKQRQYWYGIGQATVTGIGEAIGAVASFLDPYIAKFITTIFDPTTWTTLLSAASATVTDIGNAIITTLGSGISAAAADPAAMVTYWTDIGTSIWNGIVGWLEKNSPETTAAIQKLVASFTTAFNQASVDFQNMGITLWNNIIDGVKAGIEATRKNPAADFLFLFNQQAKDAFNSPEWKQLGHVALIKPELDPTKMEDQAKKGADKISKLKPVIKPTADMQNAMSKWNQFVRKVENTKIRVPIVPYSTANIGGGGRAGYVPGYVGPSHQHGYQSTVKRPTMFLAGEGGRPEDVTVRPRGSVQRGGSGGGGGGFYGTVNVYVDGVLRPARYSMGARK